MVELKNVNLQEIVDFFGTHDKCNLPSFILPDGKMLNITDYNQWEKSTHDEALGKYHPALERFQFQRDTGSIRYYPALDFINISLDIKNKITKQQKETLERCACFEDNKDILYDFFKKYGEDAYAIVRASGTLDTDDCFNKIKKVEKDLQITRKKHNII